MKTKKALSKNVILKSKEKKMTHHYLNDKYLKAIPKVFGPESLVIYLHNNEISEIDNLETTWNLTSLYLQNNRILKMGNLGKARKLRKLYLGHNSISVVEGLEKMERLEELHVEKQLLFGGNCLCFDPRTIFRISETLKILNISHNKIQSIALLAPLRSIMVLNAAHNDLQDLQDVCEVIEKWLYLKEASFDNNPMTKDRLYKETIVSRSFSLGLLDGKQISEVTKKFLKGLNKERLSQTLKKNINLAEKIKEVPKNYPVSVQKAISASLMHQHRNILDENGEIFDEANAVFIPWKTLPKKQHLVKLKTIRKALKNPVVRTNAVDTNFF